MGPTYVCQRSLAHLCGTIMGTGARANNAVTLVVHYIVFPLLLNWEPRQAGKSVDENLQS